MSVKKIYLSLLALNFTACPSALAVACFPSPNKVAVDLKTVDFSDYNVLDLLNVNSLENLKLKFIKILHFSNKYSNLTDVIFYKKNNQGKLITLTFKDLIPYTTVYFQISATGSKNFKGTSNIFSLVLTKRIILDDEVKKYSNYFPIPLAVDVYAFSTMDELNNTLINDFKNWVPTLRSIPNRAFAINIEFNEVGYPSINPHKISDFNGLTHFRLQICPSEYGSKYYFTSHMNSKPVCYYFNLSSFQPFDLSKLNAFNDPLQFFGHINELKNVQNAFVTLFSYNYGFMKMNNLYSAAEFKFYKDFNLTKEIVDIVSYLNNEPNATCWAQISGSLDTSEQLFKGFTKPFLIEKWSS